MTAAPLARELTGGGILVSVVVPVYNEGGNLAELYRRLRGVLEGVGEEYEILFVDDGSRDRSVEVVRGLAAEDGGVKLLSFSRNFGHQTAITAGLDYAMGDVVIVMDGDLQHPPELIPSLLEHWRKGYDVVYTVRQDTAGASVFKKATSGLFYWLLKVVSQTPIPANAADFRLMDRRVVEAFGGIRERTRFLRGLTGWVGFEAVGVPYTADSRFAGKSSYSFRRMLRLAINGIVSFSTLPLHVAIYIGFIEAGLGFCYALYALWMKIFANQTLEKGWTSVILVLTIVGGIQLMLMGVLGIYLGKVYEEVKQRPLYVLRRTIGVGEAEGRGGKGIWSRNGGGQGMGK